MPHRLIHLYVLAFLSCVLLSGCGGTSVSQTVQNGASYQENYTDIAHPVSQTGQVTANFSDANTLQINFSVATTAPVLLTTAYDQTTYSNTHRDPNVVMGVLAPWTTVAAVLGDTFVQESLVGGSTSTDDGTVTVRDLANATKTGQTKTLLQPIPNASITVRSSALGLQQTSTGDANGNVSVNLAALLQSLTMLPPGDVILDVSATNPVDQSVTMQQIRISSQQVDRTAASNQLDIETMRAAYLATVPPPPGIPERTAQGDAVAQADVDAFRSGDLATAAELFGQLVSIEPRKADGWYFLGQSYEGLSNTEAAEAAYRVGIAVTGLQSPIGKLIYQRLSALTNLHIGGSS